MAIVCNGSPKTGTHLLLRAVYLFGGLGLTATHRHLPDNEKITSKHIHIKRYPRNVLLSWVRFSGLSLTNENIINSIKHIIDEMNTYKEWLTDPNVLNVSFENLLTNPSELERIASYIEQPLIDNHFKKIWGNTPTFTDDLTNWRNHWSEEVNQAWVDNGGLELEFAFGYSADDQEKVRMP